MSKKKLSLTECLRLWKLSALASVPEAVLFCNAVIARATTEAAEASGGTAGNVTSRINKASVSIWTVLKTVCISMLIVVLAVCGLILILGTQKMKESVKEHFYSIVIGCMILFLAKDLAEYWEKTFS